MSGLSALAASASRRTGRPLGMTELGVVVEGDLGIEDVHHARRA